MRKEIKNIIDVNEKDIQGFLAWALDQIQDKQYVGIYGIPTSGTVLAIYLSKKAGLPLLFAPCKDCLIVEDDIQSGRTVAAYTDRYDILCYASLNKFFIPKYCYKQLDGELYETYLRFPWDEH